MTVSPDKLYTASRPELLELISPQAKIVLDVGCADGLLSSLIKDQSELKGKLAANGAFVASVPNVRHWGVIKNLPNGIWKYTEYGLMDYRHLRWFTRQTIYEMFNSVGLQIKDMSVTVTNYEKIPESFLRVCQNIGIDAERLKLESQVFQYLIKAVDL